MKWLIAVAFLVAPTASAQTLVAIGDSIESTPELRPYVEFAGWKAWNLGRPGMTSANWSRNPDWLDEVTDVPDVVTIKLGTNDARWGITEESYEAFLHDLIAHVRERWPAAEVLLHKPPTVTLEWGVAARERLLAYRSVVDELTHEWSLEQGADFYGALHPREFMDGVHPNQEGHDVMRKLHRRSVLDARKSEVCQ